VALKDSVLRAAPSTCGLRRRPWRHRYRRHRRTANP
jgi:hypothetical protein